MRGLVILLMLVVFSAQAEQTIKARVSAIPEWVALGDYKERIQPVPLKGGTYVFINDDGTMSMIDTRGNVVKMNDGIGMRLLNGTVITMKRDRLRSIDQSVQGEVHVR